MELVNECCAARTGILGLVIGNTIEDIQGRIDSSVLALKPVGLISPVIAGVDR